MAKSKKIDKELGFRLKKARLDQKLTYDELSEKSGVSSRYIKEIENSNILIQNKVEIKKSKENVWDMKKDRSKIR